MVRTTSVLLGILFAVACASSAPVSTDPGSVGAGACPIEVRNRTEVDLAITYRAGLIRVGVVPPGGRLRFDVDCGEGAIVVSGRQEAGMNPSGATCVVSSRVTPVEGSVVVASLEMRPTTRPSSNPTGCRRGAADPSFAMGVHPPARQWIVGLRSDVGRSRRALVCGTPTVIRSAWDYSTRRADFLEWARSVPGLKKSATLVEWNTDKRYLLDLPATVRIVASLDGMGLEEGVLKPTVGLDGYGGSRVRKGEVDPDDDILELASAATVWIKPRPLYA